MIYPQAYISNVVGLVFFEQDRCQQPVSDSGQITQYPLRLFFEISSGNQKIVPGYVVIPDRRMMPKPLSYSHEINDLAISEGMNHAWIGSRNHLEAARSQPEAI